MLFTSLEFLFLFLPIVITVNLILPKKLKNPWLFIASIFFYAWGEPFFVIIMLASILVNYVLALLLEKNRQKPLAKNIILCSDITLNLAILFVYKYMNFVTSLLHNINSDISVTNFTLPIGISFYTFQAISYVIDIYRGEKAQTNIIRVGLYISLFPQLIAGPIVRYHDIKAQLAERKTTLDGFSDGVFRFLIGFNKKMLLANVFANIADVTFGGNENTLLMAWLGAISYTLQIYFDFSGYSDMAIGLGKMMGFQLPKNFDYPYSSKTVTEFWRRWHMSLGQWFRDYLYFPLGGSRVSGRSRLIFNLMFVWLMTGIWHGANTTFILWGIMYGVMISIEKLFSIPQKVQTHCICGRFYQLFTMLLVVLGWVFFRSDNIHEALMYILNMFGMGSNGIYSTFDLFYLREYGLYLVIGCIISVSLLANIRKKLTTRKPGMTNVIGNGTFIINVILFLVGISYLVISAHNPFIYFNF